MHSLCKSMLNRFLPFLLILIFLLSGLAPGEETEDYLSSFIIRHGSREESTSPSTDGGVTRTILINPLYAVANIMQQP